jgi:predicted membrane protein (TIGR00267 family)
MLSIRQKLKALRNFSGNFKQYFQMAKVGEIARRYFVLNAFDGALIVLGVVLGTYVAGVTDPHIVISAGLGAGLAMSLSGVWGAYMAEKAERSKALKELESALFTDLKNSLWGRASRVATVWLAFVNGISPVAVALAAITPFFLVKLGLLGFQFAVFLSLGTALAVLFALGMFLGKISKENIFVQGVKMLSAGVLIALILYFAGLVL